MRQQRKQNIKKEIGIGIYAGFQVLHCFVVFNVDVLVLEAPPKTLNPDEGLSPVFPVHADLDVVIDKNFDEYIRCKLASMVCVEDCRTAVFLDCFFQKVCVLQGIHRIECSPAQDLP